MNYLQQRAAALGRAREIAEAAKACNRALTATGAASAALDVIPTAVGTTEALHGLTPGALVVNPVDLGTGAAGRFLVLHSPLRIRWSPQEVRRKSARAFNAVVPRQCLPIGKGAGQTRYCGNPRLHGTCGGECTMNSTCSPLAHFRGGMASVASATSRPVIWRRSTIMDRSWARITSADRAFASSTSVVPWPMLRSEARMA